MTNTWIYDDGGRADAGYKGAAGDCVTRAVAIATEIPYRQVYDDLFARTRARVRILGAAMKPELVDVERFALILGVKRSTIRAYQHREWLPEPDYRLGGRPVWLLETVENWLDAGRPVLHPPPRVWGPPGPIDF